jgi:hypothetical protein
MTSPPDDTSQYTDGPDVLDARAYGDTIPEIKLAALDVARELYGPDARLRIEHVSGIATAIATDKKFWATVTVRCLSLPDEDR